MRALFICLLAALLLATVLPARADVIETTWGHIKTLGPSEPNNPPPPHRAGLWLYPLLLTLLALP